MPTTTAPVVANLRQAGKRYGKHIALEGLDLDLHAGELLALLGPNGAGKSTTIGLLTGLLRADAGDVRVFASDPREPATRQRMGVMLQDTELPETLRVGELVRQFSAYYARPRALTETLALAGIEDLAERRYGLLSGGQKRRTQFALAICGRPDLLFVDEPTVGLDIEARRAFWTALARMRDDGTAIVLTTHYLEEAEALADRIVMLARGRVLAQGDPTRIKAHAAGKRVRFRSALARSTLSQWPEVSHVQCARGVFECRTLASDALLRRLLAADPQAADIEITPMNLEDAVLALLENAA